MNIDILSSNPSWSYYFIILGPVSLFIALSVILLKYRRAIRNALKQLSGWEEEVDEESQISSVESDSFRRLISAASHGYTAEVLRILKKESPAFTSRQWASKALYHAGMANQCNTVRALLKTGKARMDYPVRQDPGTGPMLTNDGAVGSFAGFPKIKWTVLHAASWMGHKETVRYLLELAGRSDVATKDEMGLTAMTYAEHQEHEEVKKLIGSHMEGRKLTHILDLMKRRCCFSWCAAR